MNNEEYEKSQADCLDTFRLYRPVRQACGHVTEIHHNNRALEDKHFVVLTRIPCLWCAATEGGIDLEHVAEALKYHGHMRFWGELIAFRRTDLTLEEWDQIQALDIMLAQEAQDGEGQA